MTSTRVQECIATIAESLMEASQLLPPLSPALDPLLAASRALRELSTLLQLWEENELNRGPRTIGDILKEYTRDLALARRRRRR